MKIVTFRVWRHLTYCVDMDADDLPDTLILLDAHRGEFPFRRKFTYRKVTM
jgi:hypothetical protein